MESTSRTTADATLKPAPHHRAVIGNAANFWLHGSRTGFDLTHPSSPSSKPSYPRIRLQTTTTPITLSPAKAALVIIDMQNFFLSEAFGRARGPGHAASDQLLKCAIPAARKAGIQIVWLNWGLDDEDIENMPPAVKRAFGFEAVVDEEDEDDIDGENPEPNGISGTTDAFAKQPPGIAVDKNEDARRQNGPKLNEMGKDKRIYKGLGSPCGMITLPSGERVDAGRLLMRDTWNAALYPPLQAAYQEGSELSHNPDVWIHKDRMSGMWGARTACQDFLEAKGIRTLLFTGVNTDQCVSGTLTDAFCKGYDCVLLRDGCGTTSPSFARECVEFNAGRTWGFVASCENLVEGVEGMDMGNIDAT